MTKYIHNHLILPSVNLFISYLREFSICKIFQQRTFSNGTVADQDQSKLVVKDWFNHYVRGIGMRSSFPDESEYI